MHEAAVLHVLHPGLQTTVQDAGRDGWRHLGIARAGALDPGSSLIANHLLGNSADAAVLEMPLHGPTLRLDTPVRIAACGADMPMWHETDDGAVFEIPSGRPVDLPAGVLKIGAARDGVRAWLAIAGGIDVPLVMGSRSTDLRGAFGGMGGRALRAGDTLAVRATAYDGASPRFPTWWVDPSPGDRSAPVRYVPSALPGTDRLARSRWQASPRSDRQGLRLDGDPLAIAAPEQRSAPVAPGTIQVPPDGRPIVLLADAQTVGGYPRLGHVIAADLPRLAQLRPGETVRFEACDSRTATQLACAARARLARIALMIDTHRGSAE